MCSLVVEFAANWRTRELPGKIFKQLKHPMIKNIFLEVSMIKILSKVVKVASNQDRINHFV
jgi:hypothetical protein